jgi:hypothetical protein
MYPVHTSGSLIGMYWYVLVCTGMYQYMIFGTEFLSILKGTSVDILVIPEYIL